MDPDTYLDALLALPRLLAPAVSPDGAWVAWTWFGAGPVADVFAAPTDGSAAPVRLTESPENTMLVSWTPDSRGVIVAQDHEGDERDQLFRVDLDRPREMKPLTEPTPSYYIRGGSLHPNGRWLVYAMNYDVDTGREIEASWLYRHDLETGKRVVLARPAKPGYSQAELNEAGTHILYERQDLDPGGTQIWLVDIEGKGDREILNFGPAVKVTASWFPDGHMVLFLAEAGTHRRLGFWDMRDGSICWLLDDPTRNIEQAFVPRGSRSPVVVVLEIEGSRTHACIFDCRTREETRLPRVEGNLIPLRPLGEEWAGEYYRSNQPADVIRFHPETFTPESTTSLTRVWDATPLNPSDLTPAQDFRWRSADGLEIQGWLYQPSGASRGAIVKVHGGPTSHTEDRLDPQIQFFASQGFTVLAPNYRGSTGFGLPFQEAIKEDGWGGREQDDIRAGIEALIERGLAEPGKVAVTGTSYGGYSSWCAITRWPASIVAASAPICGMTDLVVDYQTTRPDLRPYSEEMMGGRPDQVPERYHQRSPINGVGNIQGRLLIVQGLRDPNVTPENVRTVREALDSAGIPYEVLVFEDEGHGIALPKNQRVLNRRLIDFFTEAFSRSTAAIS